MRRLGPAPGRLHEEASGATFRTPCAPFEHTPKDQMARVTVEDCLEKEENRFALVVLAAQRCRDLMKGEPALVNSKNKAAVIALREIAKGKVHFHRPSVDAVNEYIQEVESRF